MLCREDCLILARALEFEDDGMDGEKDVEELVWVKSVKDGLSMEDVLCRSRLTSI